MWPCVIVLKILSSKSSTTQISRVMSFFPFFDCVAYGKHVLAHMPKKNLAAIKIIIKLNESYVLTGSTYQLTVELAITTEKMLSFFLMPALTPQSESRFSTELLPYMKEENVVWSKLQFRRKINVHSARWIMETVYITCPYKENAHLYFYFYYPSTNKTSHRVLFCCVFSLKSDSFEEKKSDPSKPINITSTIHNVCVWYKTNACQVINWQQVYK